MNATYLNAISHLTARELRDFEDWAWLQNRRRTAEAIEDWLAARANGDW